MTNEELLDKIALKDAEIERLKKELKLTDSNSDFFQFEFAKLSDKYEELEHQHSEALNEVDRLKERSTNFLKALVRVQACSSIGAAIAVAVGAVSNDNGKEAINQYETKQ